MSPRGRLLLGAWSPPAAWAALIFVLSSLPLRAESILPLRGADKLAHLLEYGVLGLLAARAAARTWPPWGAGRVVAVAAALAAAYGLSDEIHQGAAPPRTFEWADLAADAVGALAGAAAFAGLRGRAGAATAAGSPPSPAPPTGSRPGP